MIGKGIHVMKIAVLSGKGGTGKTFVSVNLASCAPSATYLDCDVEEPNGHLFFHPEDILKEDSIKLLPRFDENKCIQCRKCIDFCRFNALALVGNKPKLFKEVCHSCGACASICPTGAVVEEEQVLGSVETGKHKNVTVITGFLNLGEASGVPVISSVLEKGKTIENEYTIIDCPPGSACTVMESIQDVDYCVLVGEPTIFGAHNLEMVYELVSILNKPCGVVINKYEQEENPIDSFCKKQGVEVLTRIPYSQEIAKENADGKIACEYNKILNKTFKSLLERIKQGVVVNSLERSV